MTLEEYLKAEYQKGAIDHALRAHVDESGSVSFYIHPLNVSGNTVDYVVAGNSLTVKNVASAS